METLICKNIEDYRPLLIEVGNRIKTYRMERGISKGKFSKLSRISYGRLTNMELGKIDIDLLTLERISKVLKMDIKQLWP